MSNGWLTLAEIKQILYCQNDCGSKFGEIAVRRNYLTPQQVASILEIQPSIARGSQIAKINWIEVKSGLLVVIIGR